MDSVLSSLSRQSRPALPCPATIFPPTPPSDQEDEVAPDFLKPGVLRAQLTRLEERLAQVEASVADRATNAFPAAIQEHMESIARDIARLAAKLAPGPPGEKVGSRYVADCLGCTTTWVSDMARSGQIPKSCIVEGTGDGKPWKFYKSRIENWLKTR